MLVTVKNVRSNLPVPLACQCPFRDVVLSFPTETMEASFDSGREVSCLFCGEVDKIIP